MLKTKNLFTSDSEPQLALIDDKKPVFPPTQYHGSKSKLVHWIISHVPPSTSILDAFSGSGIVAYQFKLTGKKVFANDFLYSSHLFVKAAVENSCVKLTEEEILDLFKPNSSKDNYIEKHFTNVFYTKDECFFLDNLYANIQEISNDYKQALALAAAVRTCIRKMPGGKFRSSLFKYRNKDFSHYRPKFARDIRDTYQFFVMAFNGAIFDNGMENKAFHENIFDLIPRISCDAVYFDPPYGGSGYDYEKDYFFVELFTAKYGAVKEFKGKTKVYPNLKEGLFRKRSEIQSSLARLFSLSTHIPIWIISYNNRSAPGLATFKSLLREFKQEVQIYENKYAYRFGNNSDLKELLFVCT